MGRGTFVSRLFLCVGTGGRRGMTEHLRLSLGTMEFLSIWKAAKGIQKLLKLASLRQWAISE